MSDLLPGFAAHLGLSPDEAAPAFDAALAAVREAFETDGMVTLEGIGTFRANGAFEADQRLVASVNGDYAGLTPLEEAAPVAVPFLTSFPVVPVPDEPVDDTLAAPLSLPFAAFATPGNPPSAPTPPGAEQPPARRDMPGRDDTIDADLAAAMAGTWVAPASPPVADLRSPGQHPPPDEPYSFAPVAPPRQEERAVFPTVVPAAPYAATSGAAPALDTDADRPGRPGWLVLVPVLAVVALAAWWLRRDAPAPAAEAPVATGTYTDTPPLAAGGAPAGADSLDARAGVVADGDADAAAEEAAGADAPAAVAERTDPAPERGPLPRTVAPGEETYRPAPVRRAPDQSTDTPVAAPAPARRPAAPRPALPPPARVDQAADAAAGAGRAGAAAWGLRDAGAVDPSVGGVTWVLNSADAATAVEQVARYRSMGFRSSVLTATVAGRRVHRVAVGQFPDLAAAHAARHLLPPDAPADTWLLRLAD